MRLDSAIIQFSVRSQILLKPYRLNSFRVNVGVLNSCHDVSGSGETVTINNLSELVNIGMVKSLVTEK